MLYPIAKPILPTLRPLHVSFLRQKIGDVFYDPSGIYIFLHHIVVAIHNKQENLESANSAEAKIWSGIRIRINSDPNQNVCRIAPKMLCIYSLVGMSHLAKYRKNRPVTVWEMQINLLKSPVPQRWGGAENARLANEGTTKYGKLNVT